MNMVHNCFQHRFCGTFISILICKSFSRCIFVVTHSHRIQSTWINRLWLDCLGGKENNRMALPLVTSTWWIIILHLVSMLMAYYLAHLNVSLSPSHSFSYSISVLTFWRLFHSKFVRRSFRLCIPSDIHSIHLHSDNICICTVIHMQRIEPILLEHFS